MATYDASDFQPRIGMDIFLTAKRWVAFRCNGLAFALLRLLPNPRTRG